MGIESIPKHKRQLTLLVACKKSPQTWGLKAQKSRVGNPQRQLVLQKESPDMGIESCLHVLVFRGLVTGLAKRVPRHGD